MTKHILTQEELKLQLHYDPLTGIFTRLVATSRNIVGSIASRRDGKYLSVRLNHKTYYCHYLAILYMTGKLPQSKVAYINNITTDNRYENLLDMFTLRGLDVTQEELKRRFYYDEYLGNFYQIKNITKKVGCINIAGYVHIAINGKLYLAHRLAWIYMFGSMPIKMIDHINGIKSDNRYINLRLATIDENRQNSVINKNNTSGFKGVSFNLQKNKWLAQVCLNKKQYNLGFYETAQLASDAYQEFAKENYGSFYRAI